MGVLNAKQENIAVRMLAKELLDKERKAWIERCIMAITASFAADLMDKYDWPPERVNEIIGTATANFENMLEGIVTIDDFVAWTKERGIKLDTPPVRYPGTDVQEPFNSIKVNSKVILK
jgi:hypothetical protein